MADKSMLETLLDGLPPERFAAADVQLPENMASNLHKMLLEDAYADVTMTCEGSSMKCHRAVLEIYSDVIRRMLASSFREASTNEITFSNIRFALLEKAIRFLYGCEMEVTADDVMPLLEFADMYNITQLHEICGKMLIKSINPSVAMTLWLMARTYNSPLFYASALKYCSKVFSDARCNGCEYPAGYFEIDKDMIIDLLSDAELNIPNENVVLDAIVDWVMHKPEDRAIYAQEIMEKCVRCEMVCADTAKLLDINASLLSGPLRAALFNCFGHCVLDVQRKVLKPRINTVEIAALSCCVFMDNRLAVVSYAMYGDNLDIAAEPMLCSFDTIPKASAVPVKAASIFENELFVQTSSIEAGALCSRLHQCGTPGQSNSACAQVIREDRHAYYGNKIVFVHSAAKRVLIKLIVQDYLITLIGMSISNPRDVKFNIRNKVQLFRDNMLTVCYKTSLIVFVPGQNVAHVFDVNTGRYTRKIEINFGSDNTNTAITAKRNIACVISNNFVYVICLNRLIFDENNHSYSDVMTTDDDESGPKLGECSVQARVRAPATHGCKLTAAIYGQHLFVAVTPTTKSKLVLYFTDFSDLLQLSDNERANWKRHSKTLDCLVQNHLEKTSSFTSEGNVSIFTTKVKKRN